MSTDILDVWLAGRHAGQLRQMDSGAVEFSYDPDYMRDAGKHPVLSFSMPLGSRRHSSDVVMPWLSNMLPDSDVVRKRWAARFGEHRNDPFTLLRHMGEDLPGAVQVLPAGVPAAGEGGYAERTPEQIAHKIEDVMSDPDLWVEDDERLTRFSLAGQQGKFALSLRDGRWYEPNGRAASTHIVKPGMNMEDAGHVQTQAAEFVTMRAAKYLRLNVAEVQMLDFAGTPAFVTTRFDRLQAADGTIHRIHQEDFCQALGLYPAAKYEADGGPGLSAMARLVRHSSSPPMKQRGVETVADAAAFNLLTAGVDAHAKNHSLLHVGGQTAVEPLYDLISAFGLWDPKRVEFRAGAAVRYEKEYRFRNISGRNIVRAADDMDVDRHHFVGRLQEMAEGLETAFTAAVNDVPAEMMSPIIEELPGNVSSFGRQMASRVSDEDLAMPPAPGRDC